jgi:hypothetical protein
MNGVIVFENKYLKIIVDYQTIPQTPNVQIVAKNDRGMREPTINMDITPSALKVYTDNTVWSPTIIGSVPGFSVSPH